MEAIMASLYIVLLFKVCVLSLMSFYWFNLWRQHKQVNDNSLGLYALCITYVLSISYLLIVYMLGNIARLTDWLIALGLPKGTDLVFRANKFNFHHRG